MDTQNSFNHGIDIADCAIGGEETDNIRDILSKLSEILLSTLNHIFRFPTGRDIGNDGKTAVKVSLGVEKRFR